MKNICFNCRNFPITQLFINGDGHKVIKTNSTLIIMRVVLTIIINCIPTLIIKSMLTVIVLIVLYCNY